MFGGGPTKPPPQANGDEGGGPEVDHDPMASLPKNPPIYKATGFDPTPLEKAVEISRRSRGGLMEMVRKERSAQISAKEDSAKHRAEARKAAPDQRKLEKEARSSLEKLRHEAHQSVEGFKQDLKNRSAGDVSTLKAASLKRRDEAKAELLKRQEAMHTETLRLESKLKEEVDLEVIKMATEGSILAERTNHAQRVTMLRAKAEEARATTLEAIKVAAETAGAGLSDFLGDAERRQAFALALSAAVLGIYTAKVGTGVAGRFLESRLGKPSLVRETSRAGGLGLLTAPVRRAMGRTGLPEWTGAIKPPSNEFLDGIILEKSVETRLRSVATSTRNTKRNRAPFRHLLLYGPPGTGKTLFAKGLARHSGLEYAILTGGDVAPLGRDAVTEIHKVFDWATASSKGLLLFIDESDAFLRKRSTEQMSEDLRNALNAFLYRTGGASDKFMVVYASNQPEQFDWAINDRIDEMVEFALPSRKERARMVAFYMDQLLTEKPAVGGSAAVQLADDITAELVQSMVERIEGFSGREINKLAVAWQASAYGQANATLDKALMEEVLETQLAQKRLKRSWAAAENVKYALITDTGGEGPTRAQAEGQTEGALGLAK